MSAALHSLQVIQRQTNGTFSRTWTEYKHGFGDLFGDFWIGNDNLHLLTKTPKILRVELEGWDGRSASVQYSEFQVANEDQKYKLLVQGFSGDIHDGMRSHNGKLFSTFDQDNDEFGGNCAKNHKGGWWFTACSQADLNGLKYWWYFPRPLIKSRMMIR
ncbi:angiopoietin-related protein 7-like [Argopecten irradians]|uniref:angiopoietin-related protein 7-like n=1 Tax=Argopecten irradians TaxID=31199 RepID=UPI0037181CE2